MTNSENTPEGSDPTEEAQGKEPTQAKSSDAGDETPDWNLWQDGRKVDEYEYRDAFGRRTFQVVRVEVQPDHPAHPDKKFIQRAYMPAHSDAGEKGCPEGYVWGRAKHDVPPVLYRLPQVRSKAEAGGVVFVVEGEKDVHTLEEAGFVATCNPQGAGTWRDEHTEALQGAHVVILPDNDEEGAEHAEDVARACADAAASVRVVELPGLPPKGDVTDYFEASGTRDELERLADETPEREPSEAAKAGTGNAESEKETTWKRKARTQAERPASGDREDVEAVRQELLRGERLLDYAKQTFGTGEGSTRENGEVRIKGNGGLLIDPETGVWYNHSDETGGDCLDLFGVAEYGGAWDSGDAEMFKTALRKAADFAGVDVPEPGSARGASSTQGRRAGDGGGFTLDDLKSALEDLTGAQMCARAFDLIEECAAFDDADMARARPYLLQRGFTERDFDQWKQGVNGEKKKRREKKKERKRRRIEARKEEQRREIEAGDVPRVELSDRHTRDVIRDVLDALRTYNETPRLFLRDGVPVQIQTNEEGTPRIVELTEAALSDHISRAASVTRTTRKRVKPADLPARYVQQILSRDDLPFPPLKGLTEVPVMRPNGTVLSDPGYDKETALYYKPAPGLHVEDVPDAPTEKQVKEALHELKEPLWDFPFTSEADYANMLALLLTPAVRPLIEGGNVPLAGIDAPTRGTGKSLLAEVFSLATTGRPIATMKAPKREEEWRKQITAQLIGGAQSVCLDNVKGKLKSTALEQALTSSVWQDRVLGKSEMTTVPQNATWLATGNNLRPAEDMVRRCYLIRIDAEQERPWQGRSFRHENLRGYVRENRGRIVHAMLVLARAWVSAGRPAPSVEPLGSFEEWTKAVGGILETAGVPDFLGNLHELWDTANPEETLWWDLLEALDGHYEGNAFTTKELASLLKSEYADGDFIERKSVRRIINALPERVLDKLHAGKARGAISRSLGNFFRNRKGRRFGPERWHLEEAGTRKRAKQWRAVSDPLPKSDNSANSESGESSESVPRQEEKVSHSHTHKRDVCVSEKRGSAKEQTHSPDSLDSPTDDEEHPPPGGDGYANSAGDRYASTRGGHSSGDGASGDGDSPPPPEEEPEVLWSISGQEKADMFGFELYNPDLSGDDPDGPSPSSNASPPDR
jgi:hypothetical protein